METPSNELTGKLMQVIQLRLRQKDNYVFRAEDQAYINSAIDLTLDSQAKKSRDSALEEAAQLSEEYLTTNKQYAGISKAVRALKQEEPKL